VPRPCHDGDDRDRDAGGDEAVFDGGCAMKLATEYPVDAARIDWMAAEASDAALKEQIVKQAAEYRRLVRKRAVELGFPDPLPPRFDP